MLPNFRVVFFLSTYSIVVKGNHINTSSQETGENTVVSEYKSPVQSPLSETASGINYMMENASIENVMNKTSIPERAFTEINQDHDKQSKGAKTTLMTELLEKFPTQFYQSKTAGSIISKEAEPIRQNMDSYDSRKHLPRQNLSLMKLELRENKEMSEISAENPSDLSYCDFSNGSCSWMLDGSLYRHYNWQLGKPSSAYFLGGPTMDGGGSAASTIPGYAFVDGSVFRDITLPDFYLTAWLSSDVLHSTGPIGRCLKFKYNTLGASIRSLRVLRIDHIPSLLHNISLVNQHREARDGNNNDTNTPHLKQQILSFDMASLEYSSENNYVAHTINSTQIVWESADSTQGQWYNGHVSLSTGYRFRLVFEAVPRLAAQMNRGYAAVDDVYITNGNCERECSFEKDLCEWQNSVDDTFDWSLARGSPSRLTGPARDQSSALSFSSIGGYLVASSAPPRRPGDEAWIESDWFDSVNAVCIIFYTNMFGVGVGSLSLQQIGERDPPKTVWSVSSGSASQLTWHLARVTLSSTGRFKARFVAVVGETGISDISIDSIQIRQDVCTTIPSSASENGWSCSFLDDLCGWRISAVNHHIWRRVSGGHTQLSPSSHIRILDHHMSFSVDDYQHREGATDRLISPLIQDPQGLCLSFWLRITSSILNMPRLGSVQVLLINSNDNSSIPIWRIDNHLSHDWINAQVLLDTQQPVRVAIEGIRGSGVNGLIAIDDIVIFESNCETRPLQAAVSPLDCSFDHSTCSWNTDADHANTWTLATSGRRVSHLLDNTHATEIGYLFFDPFSQRRTARLISSKMHFTENGLKVHGQELSRLNQFSEGQRLRSCLSLRYTSVGGVQEDATLSVRLRLGAENNRSQILWQITQAHTGSPQRQATWYYGQVQLPEVMDSFQLIIETIGMQAGFAIDDIRVFSMSAQQQCPLRPAAAVPALPERYTEL